MAAEWSGVMSKMPRAPCCFTIHWIYNDKIRFCYSRRRSDYPHAAIDAGKAAQIGASCAGQG